MPAEMVVLEKRMVLQAELGIGGRAACALLAAGIHSAADLRQIEPAQVYALKGIGRVAGDEIVGALARRRLLTWL